MLISWYYNQIIPSSTTVGPVIVQLIGVACAMRKTLSIVREMYLPTEVVIPPMYSGLIATH